MAKSSQGAVTLAGRQPWPSQWYHWLLPLDTPIRLVNDKAGRIWNAAPV